MLNEKEFAYLKAVIKPFISTVTWIEKREYQYTGNQYIRIKLVDNDIDLPSFENGKYYKGMEVDRKYTLIELGLAKEVE